jgi:hypothetical protein
MYGTVMIGRLADGASADDLAKGADAWRAARPDVGFVDEWAMVTDDGRVVVAVRFESREAYEALADDPTQDEWWTTTLRPLLADDPEWIDGSWSYDSGAAAGGE